VQARGCQFHPAVVGERAVAEWVEFAVRFALQPAAEGGLGSRWSSISSPTP